MAFASHGEALLCARAISAWHSNTQTTPLATKDLSAKEDIREKRRESGLEIKETLAI
jgi:hypothetical protein